MIAYAQVYRTSFALEQGLFGLSTLFMVLSELTGADVVVIVLRNIKRLTLRDYT